MSDFQVHSEEETKYWDDFVNGNPLEKHGTTQTVKSWFMSDLEVKYRFKRQDN